MKLLNSKLQPPKRHHTLFRERLVRLIGTICEKKVAAVIAGAGYGKTTLVMSALETMDVIPIWYRLDEQDTDFQVFVSYLWEAVLQHFPGSDESGKKKVVPKTNLKKQTDILLEWLALLEEKATKHIVLVLDDYHLVRESRQINHTIEFIIDRLGDTTHLIIMGRRKPAFGLSTLRGREEIIDINEKDLAFSKAEVKRFFSGISLPSNADMNQIQSSTGGWAAALILLRHSLQEKSPNVIEKILDLFKKTPGYVFSYLEENFFDTQPEPVKTFMMKSALLAEIDTDRCSRVFQVDNAGMTLKKMVEDHIMIFPVDETGTMFYLHHLFKSFLLAKLKAAFSGKEIQQLHRRIAQDIEKDDIFQAIEHYIKAVAFNDAVRIIEEHETNFLLEGKIDFLSRCLSRIPNPVIEKKPQLLMTLAKLFIHYGSPGQAKVHLTRAHGYFKKQASRENMVKCLVGLGSHYFSTGYIKESKLLLEQVMEEVDTRFPEFTITMVHLIILSTVLGELKTAQKYYETARKTIAGFPDFRRMAAGALINISHTYALFMRGDFDKSRLVNEKVVKTLLELNIEISLPMAYSQKSAISYFFGKYEQGAAMASKGIDICEKISLSDSQKGWIYLSWAQNCLGLETVDKAIELIASGIELFEEQDNRWGLANAWDWLHRCYLAQGKHEPARQALNNAMDIIQGYGLVSTEAILENRFAALLITDKNFSKALDCLEKARKKLDGFNYYLFENHVLTSKCYFKSNRTQKAMAHLSHGLGLSQENGYDRFLQKEAAWIIPLLDSDPSASRLLKNKTRAKGLLITGAGIKLPRLGITLLGQFKLTINGKDVPVSGWKSLKALMIFKYLAANRDKGFIQKEVLIEMLWPNEDMQKTGPRFNTAMSALRKTLEPQLPPRHTSAYIDRKKDMYRLAGGPVVTIDTEQFSEALKSAKAEKNNPEKALQYYLLAESFYRGAFLKEDPFDEWCQLEKERFSADYLKLLKAVAKIYDTLNDKESAARYFQKIMTTDPLDEQTIERLMVFYAGSGNMSDLNRVYLTHRQMAEDMDCPVNPVITTLYNKLVR